MPTEARLTARIVAYLKSLGPECFYLKIHGGPMQRAGVPDLLILHKGRWFLLEVKTPEGVVSPLQEATMRRIRAAGGETGVVRSLEDLKRALGMA